MDRLTEHLVIRGREYIRIKGCKELHDSKERKGANTHNAVVRLAELEDKLERGDLKEVVYCKECKHWHDVRDVGMESKIGACERDDLIMNPARWEHEFCFRGERRDSDG